MERKPEVPPALLKHLDTLFPARCPDPKWSTRKVWMEAGKRAVVEYLQRISNEQNGQ